MRLEFIIIPLAAMISFTTEAHIVSPIARLGLGQGWGRVGLTLGKVSIFRNRLFVFANFTTLKNIAKALQCLRISPTPARRVQATMGTVKPSTNYEGWSSEQLINRVKELEAHLTKSPSTPSKPKKSESVFVNLTISPPRTPRPFDFDKYPTRYIAIKYAYLGWHYNGLAYCDPALTPLPTVELELFKALEKTKLIQSQDTCKYSRCGRTDRGVSAMGQVSAMIVRSNVNPEDRIENGGRGYSLNETGKTKGEELDYVQILNGVLPLTIRVLAWCPVPESFDARFSCRGRHYRYFFTNVEDELDVEAMRKAARYFLGEHDFRNFCKLDVQKQITNFRRRIDKADIVPYEGVPINSNSKMWMLELHGTAFLWHQVRCMMAILFLVGQGLEEPQIVRDLMDTEKFATKPEYEMAHDVPLVLYDCLFDGLEWKYPDDLSRSRSKLLQDAFSTWHEHKLQETLSGLLCTTISQSQDILTGRPIDKVGLLTGVGERKSTKGYRKVAKRTRQEAFEVMNERYRKSAKYEQHQRKMEAKAKAQENNNDTIEGVE